MAAERKSFASVAIASAGCGMVKFLWIVKGLLCWAPERWKVAYSVDMCQSFAFSLAIKINCICVDLDATLVYQDFTVQGSVSCLVVWDSFQVVWPEDVDKILGGVYHLHAYSTLACVGFLDHRAKGLSCCDTPALELP